MRHWATSPAFPTTTGDYTVALTATDGTVTASVSFSWAVTQQPPFVLDPLAASTPAGRQARR